MHRPRGPFVWLEAGTSRAFYSSTVYIRIYPVCSSSVHRCAFHRLCSMSPPPPPPPLLLLRLLWHLLALILSSLPPPSRPSCSCAYSHLHSVHAPSSLFPLAASTIPENTLGSGSARLLVRSSTPHYPLSRLARLSPAHAFSAPTFFCSHSLSYFFPLFLKREK